MTTRRRFLTRVPAALFGAAAACRPANPKEEPARALGTEQDLATAGAPPTFGTMTRTGPEVSPGTFAEAEKLVQVTMTDREREWLEFASLLHDIGAHISFVRHHRHSYYLIKNGDLRGFGPDEIEVIALVARYHRRGTPKRSHDEYAGLPAALRRTVRMLASILRVAESLDRSHGQVISSLELRDAGKDAALLIRTAANADAELELWAANRHGAKEGDTNIFIADWVGPR